MRDATTLTEFPFAKADLCVKCGLCLPHCPTYAETRHEAESPRGRIALMQGLAGGLIPHTPALQSHLDACLSCRSCERVCPAQVPYGEIIDAGRTLLAQRHAQHSRLIGWLSPWLTQRRLRRLARALLRMYQRSGLQTRLRDARLLPPALRRWASLIPMKQDGTPSRPGTPGTPGTRTARAERRPLQLFRGCINEIAEPEVLDAIESVFTRCGFDVSRPARQTCCGALHQHNGRAATAGALALRNVAAFGGDAPIIYAASGCGATLQEYGHVGGPASSAFAARVREPHRLLLEHWPADLQLRSYAARIAVHLPCTQRNVTGGGEAMLALLGRIPAATLLPLDLQHGCCGAAGTYLLTQPAMADQLLERKLDAIAAIRPEVLVSSNIGCTLHLAAGLRRRGLRVPVLHPFALLAQQWPSDPPSPSDR